MAIAQEVVGGFRKARSRADRMSRPTVIGLDCDGVLASDRLLWEHMVTRFPQYIPAQYEDLASFEWPRVTEETAAFCAELSADPLFALRLPPVVGMVDALMALAMRGYELHVITARPRSVHDATRLWLRHQGVGQYVRGIHCVGSGLDKVPLALELGCAAFVEDNRVTAEALAATGIRSYLMDAPYNHGVDGDVLRVRGWQPLVGDMTRAIQPRRTLEAVSGVRPTALAS